MTHVTDEDMVMHYYGEADGLPQTGPHLAECEECRHRFDELSRALQAISAADVPERGDGYGSEVWARIRPQLEAPEPEGWARRVAAIFTWPRLAAAGAIAALAVAAFVAGRSTAPRPAATHAAAAPETAAERAMLAAVGSHLERSYVVLTEIAHRNGGGPVDISPEQATAVDLVAANRLFRQAAAWNGDAAVAAVLEDLEGVLVEIASSPSPAPQEDLARWRDRIESRGLLFKISVMGSRVRDRQKDAAAASQPGRASST